MQQKQIASYDNYLLANMTMGMLEEEGIICKLNDENTILTDPLLSNAIGGIKLNVAEHQYDRAVNIIRVAENNFLKEIPCKKCKTNNLQIEEETNVPTTFWGKLKNNILYGQTNLYSKNYRCTNCFSLLDSYN